ncbi:hypothetical protein KKA14_11050 [bacterium]|nr:hypothetical protein [bacterium]
MLLPFTKIRQSKERKQAEHFVRKGLSMLEGNFFNKAMYEFQQAVELNPDIVSSMLTKQLENKLEDGRDEAALNIGLIVIKIQNDNYKLINTLGNCARKLKKYKQANTLYRQAFRINRAYDIAIYNLAASMGRVSKYDYDVKNLIDRFANINDYILPRYKNGPDFIEKITEKLEKNRKEETHTKESNLETLKDDEATIQTSTTKPPEPEPKPVTYVTICEDIKDLIKWSSQDLSTPEKITRFEENIFDLGLYALSKNDTSLALKCFFQLKKRKSNMEHLDMLITLAMDIEQPSKKLVQHLMILLGEDKTNRYLNVNLGLMFKRKKNRILSYKYLAIGALLLDKTGGIYCRLELVEMADNELEVGNLEKAFKLYQLVDSEKDFIHVKLNIAQIFLYQNQLAEALLIYKKIQEIDPENEIPKIKLQEIHDNYFNKGEELFFVRKYSASAAFFDKALGACRLPETIRKTSSVYRQLMDYKTANQLMNEYSILKKKNKSIDSEEQRKAYIQQGKAHLVQKNYDNALEYFERAFPMKADKDVFVYIAHILKAQNKTRQLKDHMLNWKKMIDEEGISFDQL